ncbi:hypothetical protein D9619_012644 [Psilocybe cf. subviscida]|uniref:Mid2 domain-containing protein n=1 Tax=Psilocybe cf. subviscida TaxID=2480587 RepID=A0A8H5EZG8_9AGAR|nr:hypothetical protein D9619_012644 [Psilocybe cf. subviscida]
MADSTTTGADVVATGTHPITVTSSSQPRASSGSRKSRPTSTGKRKESDSTTTANSLLPPLFTPSTSITFAKGVDHPITVQGTDIGSGALLTSTTVPTPSSSPTNILDDTKAGSSDTLGPGLVTAVAIGTVIVILLPIVILCLRRRRIVNRTQRTKWWKRRRPVSQGYDDNPFSSEMGRSTPTSTPTPTPQWATGGHVYRPGDPPIPPEEDEVYWHTLKSKLALDPEHTRTKCLSAASSVSHDSMQRPSPVHDAGSQPSLPLSTRTVGSSDPMLSSSLSLPASHRSRTISLKPICLSDYPPIPPLPKSPPPPPPFPRVRHADSYVFVVADPSNDPSRSTS